MKKKTFLGYKRPNGDVGIRNWVAIMWRHARINLSTEDTVAYGTLARALDPSALRNAVATGAARNVNGASVVILDDRARAMFADIAADAVLDAA